MDEPIPVRGLGAIPGHEVEWRFTTSGGPGGQHANRARTRVEATFDVDGSSVLTDDQRARLRRVYGGSLTVVADEERSQRRNRMTARLRLAQRIEEGIRVPKRRVATRASRGARERRLEAKRLRAEKKRQRAWRPPRGD